MTTGKENRRYRVLIAEDEDPLREELLVILGKCNQIAEITEITDGKSLKNELNKGCHDIAFLDIDLPVASAMEVLSEIKVELPVLVFITAYSEYISDAIELKAADYIIKPYNKNQIDRALKKAFSFLENEKKGFSTKGVFWLKDINERYHPIYIDSIIYLKSFDGCTYIYTTNGLFRSYKPLKDFFTLLPADQFIYTHRSIIVNLKEVGYLECLTNSQGEITLKNHEDKIPVSRRYLKHIIKQIY